MQAVIVCSRSLFFLLTYICLNDVHFFFSSAEEFEPLGQSLGWDIAGINLLQRLAVAQHDRAYTEYSLTRDAIADVSPKGDFVPFLEGAYNGVMEAIPRLAESEDLAGVLCKIAPTNELRFRQVLANSKVLERGPLQDYICKVLGHL